MTALHKVQLFINRTTKFEVWKPLKTSFVWKNEKYNQSGFQTELKSKKVPIQVQVIDTQKA